MGSFWSARGHRCQVSSLPIIRIIAITVQTHCMRCYNQEYTRFIVDEIKRLLEADIIEPARSPWRAQVLVVKKEGKG